MKAQGGMRRGRDGALRLLSSARSRDIGAAAGRSPLIGLRRGVVVVGLLAGLFGMHGFGVDHGMPRPLNHAAAMAMTSDAPAGGVAQGHVVASVAVFARLTGMHSGHGAPDQQMNMGRACLAVLVLVAVALVLLLLAPARNRRAAAVVAALPRRWTT